MKKPAWMSLMMAGKAYGWETEVFSAKKKVFTLENVKLIVVKITGSSKWKTMQIENGKVTDSWVGDEDYTKIMVGEMLLILAK
jgi:hypothetical protein